jgi:hypothetical protein
MSRQMHFWVDEPYKPTFEQMELAAGHLIKLRPKDPFIYCKVMGLVYEHVMAGVKRAINGEDFYINPDLWALFLVREEWLGREDLVPCSGESAQEILPAPPETQRQNLSRPKMMQRSLL